MARNVLDSLVEILFGVASSFVKETNKRVDEFNKKTEHDINNYTRRYSERSNEELRDRYNNSSTYAEKAAIRNIINERKGNK